MRGDRLRSLTVVAGVVTWASLLTASLSYSQGAGNSVALPAAVSSRDNLKTLERLVEGLYAQVQDLSLQVRTMQTNERDALAQVQELRTELQETRMQLASLTRSKTNFAAFQPASLPTQTTSAGTSHADISGENHATNDRIAQLEEDLDLANSKINEQSQTKVESGSKYRVRLNGFLLLNVFANRGAADSQDVPQIARPMALLESPGTFGGTIRQSQIGLQAFGPDVAGAHTSADLKLDFAGGFPQVPNGTATGLARLRTGTVRFDWADTSLIAGQDYLFFSPLSPTSFASIATPALSYSGNLYAWVPQVRIEHRFHVSESTSVLVQGGVLDSLSGDIPQNSYARSSTWGEKSGQPAYAAHVAWNRQAVGQTISAGAGGYYGRQDWGLGRSIDAWAGTADLTLPLGKLFEFTGQFYRGRAIGGLAGGIGQSVLWNGSLSDPATAVYGLNAMGGWLQLKVKPNPKWELNGAFGDDNPFSLDLSEFSGNPVYSGSLLSKNMTSLVNVIFVPRSDMIFSLEYRRLKTFHFNSNASAADHINLSVGYVF